MNPDELIHWSGFPGEFGLYFIGFGMVSLVLLAIGCLLFAVLAIRRRGSFLRRTGKLALLLGLLLVIGSFANGVWSCTVWGRLYYTPDYVFDFSALWPITQGVIDATFGDTRGQLFGVSLFQLQMVWLLFAGVTWTLTILLYRLFSRRPSSGGQAESVAENGNERISPEDSDRSNITVAAHGC